MTRTPTNAPNPPKRRLPPMPLQALALAAAAALAAPATQASVSVELVEATNARTVVRIRAGAPALLDVATPDGTFQRFDARGMTGMRVDADSLSKPELPLAGFPVALPLDMRAAAVGVQVQPEGTVRFRTTRLYPVQPAEEAEADNRRRPPFGYVPRIYSTGAVNPGAALDRETVFGDEAYVEKFRFMPYGYNPDSQLLTWHDSYLVTISHSAGNCFGVNQLANRAVAAAQDAVDQHIEDNHRNSVTRYAINQQMVAQLCADPNPPQQFTAGARFVIVTHPDFVDAANALKNHKEAMGISTVVVKTTDISGPVAVVTASAIRNWLRDFRQTRAIKPKWVLLMGDAEKIPTHYDLAHDGGKTRNAGDVYFGQIGLVNGGSSATSVPLVGVGRFPVDTLAQANTMVANVMAYELNPPPDSPLASNYYNKLTFASFFEFDADYSNDRRQDSRWFVEGAEFIRNHVLSKGQQVQRIYKAFAADDPQFYRSGNPYPAALKKPGFAWNGSSADIVNAFNAGTSLFFHRDHGGPSGWGDPDFKIANLNSVSITGNRFPVVFSINCASGVFDNETVNLAANLPPGGVGMNVDAPSTYWAEAFVRKSDGAIAVIGDTRNSKTVDNTFLAIGLFDAIYPGLAPGFGSSLAQRRLGDVLKHGMAFLVASDAGTTTNLHPSDQGAAVHVWGLRQQMNIYNLFGDPTLKVRTGAPPSFGLITVSQNANVVNVNAAIQPCRFCAEPLIPEFIPVVITDPVSGRVLGRSLLDANGRATVDIGTFRSRFVVRVSSDVGGVQQASNVETDTDRDGVPDSRDNCTTTANADQKDSDGDGYGDACDADANNDGIVNSVDQQLVRSNFGSRAPTRADLNGDGIVNALDLSLLRRLFATRPGPSAWVR